MSAVPQKISAAIAKKVSDATTAQRFVLGHGHVTMVCFIFSHVRSMRMRVATQLISKSHQLMIIWHAPIMMCVCTCIFLRTDLLIAMVMIMVICLYDQEEHTASRGTDGQGKWARRIRTGGGAV